jgi:ABC-type transport system involved in multi-copper enzyme maturation permease subunit
MTARTIATVAALTLKEATRRRVLRALAVLTVLLLALSAWGFHELDDQLGGLTTGEARLTASILLNLVMFGISLIAALGTAFLAGPTLAGDMESGIALAYLARPVRRWAVLVGKWLGLVAFGCGFVLVAGLAQFVVVKVAVGYWPPQPLTGLALLGAETTVLLTLGLLLATAVSPMASGIVAVGLFGATWVAGVVGGVGEALGSEGVARVGTVSRMLLPTDGLWHAAMGAFQDQAAVAQLGGPAAQGGLPFLSGGSPTFAYLTWCTLWVLGILALAAAAFRRRDL